MSGFFWILNVCWHFEHEEPNAVCVAALPTKLAWENVKCKSSVKVNKTRNLHVETTAHCFSWMFFIIPFPSGSPIIYTFALFCILIRANSLSRALWWTKAFYSNAIQSKCCCINYSLTELCAVTSSEPFPEGEVHCSLLMKSSEKSDCPPVLEPEIGILNSNEFLLVKGATSIPVLGNTYSTKNTRGKGLIDHGILKITWLLGFPNWEERLWLWNTRNNLGFGAHTTVCS